MLSILFALKEKIAVTSSLQNCQDYVWVPLKVVYGHELKLCDRIVFGGESESWCFDLWNVGIAGDAAEEARGSSVAEDGPADQRVKLS